MRNKKIVYGILTGIVLMTILLLTLQSPAGSARLSEGFRKWLVNFGIHSSFHSVRSNAHIVLYFVLGIVLSLFGRECNLKWWVIIALGCIVGLMDECLKIFLPTREFDIFDLFRDWVGIIIGTCIIAFIKKHPISR